MKPWTKKLTTAFISETTVLIETLVQFRKRWDTIAGTHQKPKGDDADTICDKEADLSDCLDRFMDESG